MSKIITSPVDRRPGTVTLADPLTLPQVIAIQDASEQIQVEKNRLRDLGLVNTFSTGKQVMIIWPALNLCIEAWAIEGLDQDINTAPIVGTDHKREVFDLYLHLWEEVTGFFRDSEDVPEEADS